jgi:Fe2+ transport system protein FeoA
MGCHDEGGQVRRRARIRRRLGSPAEGSSLGSDQPLPLSRLRPGQEGRVVYIATADGRRLEQLSGLGLFPDAVVRLLQKRPAAVIQVGETELAIDLAIAREIYVRPLT